MLVSFDLLKAVIKTIKVCWRDGWLSGDQKDLRARAPAVMLGLRSTVAVLPTLVSQ